MSTASTPEGKAFLGAGIAFPLGVDAGGRVAMNSLDEHVRQSILLILTTGRGERVMAPDFGAGLSDFAFQPMNNVTVQMVKKRVTDSLTRFEPRIQLVKVDVTATNSKANAKADSARDNVLLIEMQYYIRRVDTMFNLVYPFYLDRGLP